MGSEQRPPRFILRAEAVTDLKFLSRDLLVTAHEDGCLSIWDVVERRVLDAKKVSSRGLISVNILNKHEVVAQCREGSLSLHKFNFTTNKFIATETSLAYLDCTTFGKAAITPDRQCLACPTGDGQTIGTFNFLAPTAACSSTEQPVPEFVAGAELKLNVEGLQCKGKKLERVGHVSCLAALPSGVLKGRGVAVGYESGFLAVWDCSSDSGAAPAAVVKVLDGGLPVTAMGICPIDSSKCEIWAATADGGLTIFSVSCNHTSNTIQVTPSPQTFSPATVSGHADNTDIAAQHGGANSLTVRPDAKLVVCGGWDHRLYLYGVEGRKRLGYLNVHSSGVSAVAFQPYRPTSESKQHADASGSESDSDREEERNGCFASASTDGRICFWDVYSSRDS